MPKLQNGHAPGHVRDTFVHAIKAFACWNDGEPEPTVEFEVNYVPRQIPISQACSALWNCTDIIPAAEFNLLRDMGLPIRRGTYAACARALKTEIGGRR